LGAHTSAVQKLGLDDEAVLELMAVVDLMSGYNKLMDGLRVEVDEKPWYG
jgi:alkylhydroperoxidase family enzyme